MLSSMGLETVDEQRLLLLLLLVLPPRTVTVAPPAGLRLTGPASILSHGGTLIRMLTNRFSDGRSGRPPPVLIVTVCWLPVNDEAILLPLLLLLLLPVLPVLQPLLVVAVGEECPSPPMLPGTIVGPWSAQISA
uniref:Putative secreted protein n=1 Tax=Anopheles triannulatus TaxID=58253 RepID=A0A2M4B1N0_9DIPT